MNSPLEVSTNFLSQKSGLDRLADKLDVRLQRMMDRVYPYRISRWCVTLFFTIIFILRVVVFNGWYVIAYCFAIYLLGLSLYFISPKFDPEAEFDDEDEPGLPMYKGDEFRPFIRKLPEFKFWVKFTVSLFLCLSLTTSRLFDIPVYVPILVVYFIFLSIIQFQSRVRHMIKFGYVPWTRGKQKFDMKK